MATIKKKAIGFLIVDKDFDTIYWHGENAPTPDDIKDALDDGGYGVTEEDLIILEISKHGKYVTNPQVVWQEV